MLVHRTALELQKKMAIWPEIIGTVMGLVGPGR